MSSESGQKSPSGKCVNPYMAGSDGLQMAWACYRTGPFRSASRVDFLKCYPRLLRVLGLLRSPNFSLFLTSRALSCIRLPLRSRTGLALIGSGSTHSSSVITDSVLGSLISRSRLLTGVSGREVTVLETWPGLGAGLSA